MTKDQIQLVQQSLTRLVPSEDDSLEEFFGEIFYNRLFGLDPALKTLFTGDPHRQGHALLNMLRLIVSHLEQPEGILPEIRSLGVRHAAYGVREADYATAGVAFLWTLEATLGDDFTPELRTAWVAAYTLVVGVMQDASRRGLVGRSHRLETG